MGTDCKENPHSASYDSDQLVHVSNCLLVPNVRLFCSQSSCVHPGGVLCIRHHSSAELAWLSIRSRTPSLERRLSYSKRLAFLRLARLQCTLIFPVVRPFSY